MARKSNPILTLVAYFEKAPLEAAEQGLALAKAIVAKRRPTVTRRRGVLGTTTGNPVLPQQQHTAKPPRQRKPKDVPLPGVVSQVGD